MKTIPADRSMTDEEMLVLRLRNLIALWRQDNEKLEKTPDVLKTEMQAGELSGRTKCRSDLINAVGCHFLQKAGIQI